jgi:serine protease inhibitor
MNVLKFIKGARARDHESLARVVQANTGFALSLYQKLLETEGNLFFSPFSISNALAMTCAGARGATAAQMLQVLHFLPDQEQLHPAFALLEEKLGQVWKKGKIQLEIANTLWPNQDYKLLKEFQVLLNKYYGAHISPLDFADEPAARRIINAWVEDKTQNRIQDLIPSGLLDGLTRLVLVNAIYFKGAWANPFDPDSTSDQPFSTPAGPLPVPMMNLKHTFKYAEAEGLQILELPYAGDDLSMLVLLPRQTGGLAKLEASIGMETLQIWTGNLAPTEVNVSLPKFELAFPFRLDDTLQAMGMLDAFSTKADFSGMDGTRKLFIGAALHKAFVVVNEQGTEAAAATAMIMLTKTLAFPSVVFLADHPFVFLIRENSTGSILFIGRLTNPS